MATKWDFPNDFLKISSSGTAGQIWNNFTEIFLGWLFPTFAREMLIRQETWLWWMGATCNITDMQNSLKFFFSETAGKILK